MGFSASLYPLPVYTKHRPSSLDLRRNSFLLTGKRSPVRKSHSIVPVARLFGPAIFESSKQKVLFVGVDEEKRPATLPRTYTLTHSDITSKLTLAVSSTVHQSQVLKAFVHGDVRLFSNYPELEEAQVWVYFHSNLPEFNTVECWGPLRDAASTRRHSQVHFDEGDSLGDASTVDEEATDSNWELPQRCQVECDCYFSLHNSIIPWPRNDSHEEKCQSTGQPQQ